VPEPVTDPSDPGTAATAATTTAARRTSTYRPGRGSQADRAGENIAVFHGWPEADIAGITEASPHPAIARSKSFERYPRHAAKAVELLLRSGIAGSYGLALGPDDYTAVIETSEHGGYPLLDHLRKILGGPIVWAPGVRGAVALSLRGGDFLLESGRISRSAMRATTPRPSTCTSKRASASVSLHPKPPSRSTRSGSGISGETSPLMSALSR